MSLEEEVKIVQFAQGVRSEDDLLVDFGQWPERLKSKRLHKMLSLIDQVFPTEAEIEQASAPVEPNDGHILIVKNSLTKKGLRIKTGEDELENSYAVLLNLFKTAYQRQVASGADKLKKWWCRDLSRNEVVQEILVNYRTLVEAVYHHPSFRGEFASIAKLRYSSKMLMETKWQALASTEPGKQPEKYHFVNYDEMLSVVANAYPLRINEKSEEDKNAHAASVLFQALAKALSKQYALEHFEVIRLINEIVDRHLKENHNSEPYW